MRKIGWTGFLKNGLVHLIDIYDRRKGKSGAN